MRLRRPVDLAGPALVLGVAVLTSFWGLGLRDLGSVELDEFSGSGPLGILRRSLSPTESDWGAHMPLTHVIRWWVVKLLGETSPVAWRLHVAVASCAGALLAHHLVARQGRPRLAVGTGLIVALHPMVSFHAHESGNYGFGALLGGLLLLALLRWEEGARGAAWGLAGAVVLGMASDLFFVFPTLAAVVWTSWRAARDPALRPRLLRTWGAVGAAGLGPALWLLRAAVGLESEHLIGPHADPIPAHTASLPAAVWDVLRRFSGGLTGGYLDSGSSDLWLVGGPVVLMVLMVAVLLRRPAEAPETSASAAWLVGGAFLLVLVARLVFGALTGREFTTEPRIFSCLLVPLAVCQAALCARLGPRLGAVALAGLLLMLAIPTARQLTTLSDRDARAAAYLDAHVGDGDGLIVTRQVSWRLRGDLRARAELGCLQEPATLPDRVWLAVEEDGGRLQDVRTCDGDVLASPGDGWTVRLHRRLTPPAYDRQSASFLPELVLTMLERGAAPEGLAPVPVRIQRPLLSRAGPLILLVDAMPSAENRALVEWQQRHHEAPVPAGRSVLVEVPDLPVGDWVDLRTVRPEASGRSDGGLLNEFGHPVRDLEALPVLADPLEPLVVDLWPLGAPHVRATERGLRAGLPLLWLVGLPLGLRRRR